MPSVNKYVELFCYTPPPSPLASLPSPHLSGRRDVDVFLSDEAAAGLVGGER